MDITAFHFAQAKDALFFAFMALVYGGAHVLVLKIIGAKYRSFTFAGLTLAAIEVLISFQHFLKAAYDIPDTLLLMLSYGMVLIGMMGAAALNMGLIIWQAAQQKKRAKVLVD